MNSITLDYGGALDYGVPAGTYYSDPLGEIASLTAKLEAAKQIPVPEGYRLVSLKHLHALLGSITGSCYLGEDVEIKTIKAMIALDEIATITEQAAQIEALEKDAARYRWLTDYIMYDKADYDDAIVACADKSEIDAVIDAAIQEEK